MAEVPRAARHRGALLPEARRQPKRAGFSPRQFARLFTEEVGTPPGRYVDRVRLETARRLLEEGGDDGVTAIARVSGYGTYEAMRRAFVRALDCTPTAYRSRFRSTTHT